MPLVALWSAFVLAEVFYVQVIFKREGYALSLMEIPLVIGLWFVAGPHLVAVRVSAAAVALIFYRRHRGLKLGFNLASYLLESTMAVAVFHALGAGDHPLQSRALADTLLASGAAVLAGILAVSAAIALYEGGIDLRKLLLTSIGNVAAMVTNTSLGIIAVVLLSSAPISVLLLVPPAAVLVVSYRNVILNRRKHESLEFLYEASRILHRGPVQEEPMVELLALTRDTLGADVAELTLYAPDDPTRGVRTVIGPDDQVQRLEPVAIEAGWGATDAGAQAALVHELEGEKRTLGRMVVAQPRASRRSFSAREAQLFTTLANQVSVAIENGALEASITQLTALKEELRHRAFHDELTGLANRALFLDELERSVTTAGDDNHPAVLFVDLDDFKTVNDTLGHAAGDELLREIAERLRRCVRPDDLAARLGGDEFAVLIHGVDADRAAAVVADRLLDALRLPIALAGEPVHVAASVGVARSGPALRDADELLQKADMAMYSAKVGGKGRWVAFEPAMQEATSARHAMKNRLLEAVKHDEFVVHYQPVVEVESGRVVGAEALLRWADPEHGLVLPGQFLSIAEELGMMGQLGRFVLRAAAQQMRQCHDRLAGEKDRPWVSVNVTAREFQESDFVEHVMAILADARLDPRALVLEITEGTMVDHATPARQVMQALRERGIRIAVDDFGTGYSSLSYLDELSVDILKVAKPFVDALAGSSNRPTLAQAIVQLGGALQLDVVAEGVERTDQLAALRAMGCPLAQGYLLGRPLVSEALHHLVEHGWVPLPHDGHTDSRLPAVHHDVVSGVGLSPLGAAPA